MMQRLRSIARHALGCLGVPPAIAQQHDIAAYAKFMRAEIFRMNLRYARRRVAINGLENLPKEGAVIAFLHQGSFFLIGLALIAHARRPYTAIVTGRNLSPQVLGEEDFHFWTAVHRRVSALYSRPVFYSDAPPRAALRWLRDGGYLGVALDVRESGLTGVEDVHRFRSAHYSFPRGAARLALAAGVPMVPVSIAYEPHLRRHVLSIGLPVVAPDAPTVTGLALNALDCLPSSEAQWFHSIDDFRV